MSSTDPFEDVLHLEDKFYADGYKQGVADGERAGRSEGRAFGIETGFDKFVEAGRLYGRSLVWANRLPRAQQSAEETSSAPAREVAGEEGASQEGRLSVDVEGEPPSLRLPLLAGGARLEKSVLMLHALVEPDTLATENDTEAVDDFDDRVKRAQGRARVVERQVGEDAVASRRDGPVAATGVVGSGGVRGVQGSQQTTSSSTPASAATTVQPGGSF